MSETPFISGARVAVEIDGGYNAPLSYKEATVEKAYKTGRFTLIGSPQQWRPHQPAAYTKYWHASQTGDTGWSGRGRLRIWDEDSDSEIRAAISSRGRYEKFTRLKRELEMLSYSEHLVTDEVLDWMHSVVMAVKPIPASASEVPDDRSAIDANAVVR